MIDIDIQESGHIIIDDFSKSEIPHRTYVRPNQPIPVEYQVEIEADPDFAKYRTQENADAYEAQLLADQPSEAEQLEAWRSTASLSRRRFKIGEALYQVNGTPLVELIEALLAGLPEPQKTVATIAYNESGRFDRLDQFVVDFGSALGMTDEQVDDFFRYCLEEAWNAGS